MKFEDFRTGDNNVREISELLKQLKDSLDNGELSRSEFDELSEDVLQIHTVAEYADDLEGKIKFQKAIAMMRELLALIPI